MPIMVRKFIATIEWPDDKIFRKNYQVVFRRCFSYKLFSFCKILLRRKPIDCKLYDSYFHEHSPYFPYCRSPKLCCASSTIIRASINEEVAAGDGAFRI